MTVKKTELKVTLHCQKYKSDVLKSVTKLQGVDQVSVDSEKGILTVVGDVEPMLIAERVKKTGKFIEIVSVGPPKKEKEKEKEEKKPPKKEKEKEEEEKKPISPMVDCWKTCYRTPVPVPLPPCCNQCQFVSYDTQPVCIIL